jgi:glucose/mannose-6-phosphate isomerase
MTAEVWANGRSPLARLLTLVQTGDLVTTYAALARGVDPTPIDAIVRLKRTLAEA